MLVTEIRAAEAPEPTGLIPARPPPVQDARPATASRLWQFYLAFAAFLTLLYFVFPDFHLVLWTLLGLSSVVATLVGIRRYRPTPPAAWYLLAGAEFCFIAGDTTYNLLTQVLHQDNPFPSVADLFYLLTYPMFAAGIFLFIRGRSASRDRAALIDAVIITTGLGLLSWVYLVLPYFQDNALSVLDRIISVGYPLGDVLILAMLARLVGEGGIRIRAMQFLVLGAAGLMVADALYGLIQLNGTWAVGGPVDCGWVIFYVAWGCAALHPSMVRVSQILPLQTARLGGTRVTLLAAVSLIAPAVLLAESLRGTGIHAGTVALFSAALFLLVIARLWGILRVHQQSVERERTLRSTSETLVSAQSLAEIYEVALAGVRSLTGQTVVTRAAIYAKDPHVTHGTGIRRVAGAPGTSGTADRAEQMRTAAAGGRLDPTGRVSITPLGYDVEDGGMLVVESAVPMTLDQHGALRTLAAQVSLAVESATLAENLRERRSAERFEGILQNTSDIIVIVDAGGQILYSTPSLARNLGRSSEELLGQNVAKFLHQNDADEAITMFANSAVATTQTHAVADWRLRHRDGRMMAFEVLSNNLLDDPRVGGIVLTMRDVSERRELEIQLKHQAFHDSLTGLANRALFQDRAEHALIRMSRVGTSVAMVMLDLDDFKIVNDTRGHAAGDEMLAQIATRLRAKLREDATVSRFGGDEFAVLVEDLADVDEARALAQQALQVFTTTFPVQGEELGMRASVGLVFADGGRESVDVTELMRCADLALYSAKERGKGGVVLYTTDLHTRMLERLTRRADLERALLAGEFVLYYQPIVSIETGDTVGCEALVRWQHPTRGLVPPLDFIELAEESGLIVELGRWVLDEACAQLRTWADQGHPGLRMSVNVSARQLRDGAFVEYVAAALVRYEMDPRQLVLELTEGIFALDAPAIAEQLGRLRGLGVKIAMDDFGTGYSSLSYLQKFQLDVLKIDKSFVDNLGASDEDGSALVTAIVTLAHSLRLEVVAEGIERTGQRDDLWSMGCTFGQGYLYSRPVEPGQFRTLLSNTRQVGSHPQAGERDAARLRPPTLRTGS